LAVELASPGAGGGTNFSYAYNSAGNSGNQSVRQETDRPCRTLTEELGDKKNKGPMRKKNSK
jgi:hypothetical protein